VCVTAFRQPPPSQVLNTNYAQTGATFTLASTDRTVNAAWSTASQNSPGWTAMTNALHKGTVQVWHLEGTPCICVHARVQFRPRCAKVCSRKGSHTA
jgi:hypothetical protein